MRRRKDRIQGFILFLGFTTLFFSVALESYWVALAVGTPTYIYSIILIIRAIDRRRSPIYKMIKVLKNYNLKAMDALLIEAATDFTYDVSPSYIQEYNLVREKLELFIRMVKGDIDRIILQRREFLDMNRTDSIYYEKVLLFSMSFLLENDIDNFLDHFGYYKRSITDRVESRVLNLKLNVIELHRHKIEISLELLETMYKYYEHHEDITDELFAYRPKNKLEEYIHITYIYFYLKHSEKDKLVKDFKSEFDRYQEMKRMN